MQLYALNEQKRITSAGQASKHKDYLCLECHHRVRVRGGLHRQNHFYHLEPNRHCRLDGKGMTHLQIQHFLFQLFPTGECELEYRMPEIKRIADVVWFPHKIVFEIQCSPISAKEVQQRNTDYKKLGWDVVWILHDRRYNRKRITAAEQLLRSSTHYFTNINRDGEGIIYDQFDIIQKGLRLHQMESLPVQLNSIKKTHSQVPLGKLRLINYRLYVWSFSFKGDLIDLNGRNEESSYLQTALTIENRFNESPPSVKEEKIGKELFKNFLYRYVIRPYSLFFQIILERFCR